MKVSEYTVLQIVGLDAAVASLLHNAYAKTSLTCKKQLLSFFKTSFYLFSVCSLLAVTILMPINLNVRISACLRNTGSYYS